MASEAIADQQLSPLSSEAVPVSIAIDVGYRAC